MRTQRAEHVRSQQRDVVAEQGVAGQRDERRRDRRQAQQVFGEGERARRGIEDRRIPPVRRQRHRLRRPPQDPGVEDRIAGIVRDAVPKVQGERPRIRQRECEVEARGQRDGLQMSANVHVGR